MKVYKYNTPAESVFKMYKEVLTKGDYTEARGLKVLELSPVLIQLDDPAGDKRLISELRDTNIKYVIAELNWYLSGRNDSKYISNYAPFWKSIADNQGVNNSAYGYWLFNKKYNYEGVESTQWRHVYDLLKEDAGTRKAVLYLGGADNYLEKDTICTNTLQFKINAGGRLDLHVNMRSNDVKWGYTNDVVMFTMFQELMARNLDIPMGTYYHYAASMHVYEKDWVSAKLLKSNKYSTAMQIAPMQCMIEWLNETSDLLGVEKLVKDTSAILFR